MPKQRFGQEVRQGSRYVRLKRYSMVVTFFVGWDNPHSCYDIHDNRSWKRYRKTQYKANK